MRQQALGNRFLGRVSFFDTLIDACAAANRDGLAATAGRIVVLLGGIHDAGEGGVCLSGAGSKLVGAVGEGYVALDEREGGGVYTCCISYI